MKLHYRKLGQGKPFFILHGLFGLSDNWLTIGKKLSENFCVYLVDLRNHGSSPHSDEWTYPAMVEDVRELMKDVIKDNSAILLGHSLGGKVAMQFASMYPEKLEKLIVVDIAPKKYDTNSLYFISELASIRLEELKSRKEVEQKLSAIIKEESIKQLLLKNIYWKKLGDMEFLSWKCNLKVIAENQKRIEETFSVKSGLQVPALFIKGEKSEHIQESDIPAILKIFPLVELKTIGGAGHWVHADKPKEFIECILIYTGSSQVAEKKQYRTIE
jgi:pimeloyl-ACP methyl ester carboxylesterase